jgi:acyl-coenzyme A synthetase/AMP-(fatty) acid ligase
VTAGSEVRPAAPVPTPARAGVTLRIANVAAHLADRAARNGWLRRTALRTDEGDWTHGEVHNLAARAATVLAGHGIGPGDRVLVALPDGVGWVVTFLGLARLGAVAVVVNPELPAADHAVLAADCAPRLCVSTAALEGRFEEWLDVADLLARAAVATAATPHPVSADTPLYVQYTSGTTGEPKGAVHTHGDLPIYHDAVGAAVLGVSAADVTLSVSRLYYAYGLGNAFAFPLYSGSSVVLAGERPSAERVAELVARHRVSLLYAVPSAYAALVESMGRAGHAGPAAFRSVRAAVSAGEALPPALGQRASALLGAPVCEQIGSTEAGHAFCANPVHDNVPGTVGRPVPGFDLALRDRDGAPSADGVAGELWVRGPTLLREYLGRPEQSARVLVDGWLATRDLVVRGADGTYRHVGRVDDMEMVGGITVSPIEVERVLAEHPLVGEVAVAAVRDDAGASKLRAFVVPVGSIADPALFEADLLGLARGRLAPFKVPRTVRVVPALPRTPTGKLRRHVVRGGAW